MVGNLELVGNLSDKDGGNFKIEVETWWEVWRCREILKQQENVKSREIKKMAGN